MAGSRKFTLLRKTMGMVYCLTNCGFIVAMAELYGSESKTQVYDFVLSIMAFCLQHDIAFPSTNCYDDGCHLLQYIMKRQHKGHLGMSAAVLDITIDKTHFPNHT